MSFARVFFKLSLLAILLATVMSPLIAQEESAEIETQEMETSPFLFDLSIGDTGVDLVWDGYWRLRAVAGTGFGPQNENTVFQGLTQGFNFSQEPDVTVTLWINDSWFIETTFLEGFERNSYRAGYEAAGDGFVRSVSVGNAGVTVESYADIEVPAPRFNTPGIAATFGTDRSEHALLLRYDPTEEQEKIFQGEYEVKTEDIPLPSFVEGRYFILPDRNVTQVQVYLEDRLGMFTGDDGRRYRPGENAEYFVDLASGLVVLSSPWTGRVLVYYESPFGPVGDDSPLPVNRGGRNFVVPADANLHPDFAAWAGLESNLRDFDWSEIDLYDSSGRSYGETSRVGLDGQDALVLFDPGRFTPFERQNVYLSSQTLPEETWRIVALLRDRGALYPQSDPNYGWIADPSQKTLIAYGAVGAPDGLRNPGNRYPFAWSDGEIYGQGRETDGDKVARKIVLAVRESNAGYSLGTGVVPGSVMVTVNGVRDKTVDISDDGSLTFNRYIFPDDWIRVAYRTETVDLEGGDFYAFQGNRFNLAPRLTLDVAETVRWNLSQDRSVTDGRQSPGEVRVAATLDWREEDNFLTLTGEGVLSTANTAGNYRLFGMESGGYDTVFSTNSLQPSPETDIQVERGSTGVPATLDALDRRPLDRYDYISTNVFGQEILNTYVWSEAISTGEDGPALAGRRSGDPSTDRVMDLRFDLQDGEWAAGDVVTDLTGPVDFSAYTVLEIPLKVLADSGDPGSLLPSVHLQIGEIGESEDHHQDGSVDQADPGLSLTWDLSGLSETADQMALLWSNPGQWQTLRITLGPGERARLTRVRSTRIIVDNETGGAIAGRLIVGAPSFEGSPFRGEIRTDPGNSLAPNQDITVNTVVDSTLLSTYPETAELFHSSGSSNQALRIQWGNQAPGGSDLGSTESGRDRWEAVSWFDGVALESYRTLVFFLRADQAVGPVSVDLSDEEGLGISLTYTPPGTGWDRITVDIAAQNAVSDQGGTIQGLSIDQDAGELTRIVLNGTDQNGSGSTSSPSGTVYFDELYFRDPAFAVTGGVQLEGHWSYEDDLVAIGSFPVLGNVSLDGRATLDAGTVLSGLDRGDLAATGSVAAQADVLGLRMETAWRTNWSDRSNAWSGSHSLRLPARWDKAWISDVYTRGVNGDEVSFSRRNAAGLSLGPFAMEAYTEALYDQVNLIQSWGGEIGWTEGPWTVELTADYIVNTEDAPVSQGDYVSSWIADFALILPVDEEVIRREAHHEFETQGSWGPLSIQWDPTIRLKASQAPLWNQENGWEGSLSLPLNFDGGWSLTSTYRRSLKNTVGTLDSGLNGSFLDSWTVFAQATAPQIPLVTYVPFRELVGTQDGEIFAEKTLGQDIALYEAEFSVSLSRPDGGIVDLFLPSTLSFSMERDYERRGDTSGWQNDWQGEIGLSALNLFGRFGRYPILGFYNSEELTQIVQLTFSDYNGTAFPAPSEAIWQTYAAFAGNAQRQLIFDHKVSWLWDTESRRTVQEAKVEFQWRTDGRDVLHIPLINRAIIREHFLKNSESLIVTGVYPWQDAPEDTAFDLGFTLRHETKWTFQDSGYLMGWVALGLGARDESFTNGVEIGLEAEIRF